MKGNPAGASRWRACLAAALLLLSALPAASAAAPASAPLASGGARSGMLRVGMLSLGQPARLDLTLTGDYSLSGAHSRALASGTAVAVSFSAQSGRFTLTLPGETLDAGPAFKLRRHSGTGTAGFRVAQGRVPQNLYPADLYLTAQPAAAGYRLVAVAYVFLEDYLYGVLPYEMGGGSHPEALKAQAVTARTYAIGRMGGSGLYDVADTTADQVYAGTPSGDAGSRAAVDATRGIVMMTGGAYTATLYTASNGGQTESPSNAWGSSGHSYLSVRDDPYDLANPQSRVKTFLAAYDPLRLDARLKGLLLQKARALPGRADAQLERIVSAVPHTPRYPAPSRLYTRLDFTVNLLSGETAVTAVLSFDIFRELEAALGMGINAADNELWRVARSDEGFVLTAARYGHGIGMSQRGAMQMGAMGYTYDQVLGFYYPGCRRVAYTLGRSILSAYVPGVESAEELSPVDPAAVGEESAGRARVTLSQTPLYQKADSASFILALLPQGAYAEVLSQAGDFYGVRYGQLTGFLPRGRTEYAGAVPGAAVGETRLEGFGTVYGTGALNLRAAPSLSAAILLTMPRGARVPILSLSGHFAYVQYGLQAGYASLDFLERSDALPAPAWSGAPADGTVRALAGGVPLRARPDTSSAVLKTLADGAAVTVLALDESWARVRSLETEGYLPAASVELAAAPPAPAPATPPPAAPQTARVVTAAGSLNLREQPSPLARVLRTIPRLAVVGVTSRGAEWCAVTYDGTRGYAMTCFLRFDSPASPTPSAAPAGPGALVVTPSGSLNFRERPSLAGRVLATVPRGTRLPVLSRGETWSQVLWQGRAGYVMSAFLDFSGTAGGTPAPDPGPAAGLTLLPLPLRAWAVSGIRIRAAASDAAAFVAELPAGDAVLADAREGAWHRVTYNGKTGFVPTASLRFTPPGALPSPSASPAPAPSATPRSSASPAPDPSPTPGAADEARDPTLKRLPVPYASRAAVPEGGTLKLRLGCSDRSLVLAGIPSGDALMVLELGEDWCRVAWEGREGYCMTRYLSLPGLP